MTYPLKAFTDASISFVRKHLEGYFKIKFYKKKKQEKYFNTEYPHNYQIYSHIHLMCNNFTFKMHTCHT